MSAIMGILWPIVGIAYFIGNKAELGFLCFIIGVLYWILRELEKMRRDR